MKQELKKPPRTLTEKEFTKEVLDIKDKLFKEGLERIKGRTDAEVRKGMEDFKEEELDKE